jgi:glutamyl-tRNA reductase
VSFGKQLWPHTDDRPATQHITYRNDGAHPVTLDLTATATGPGGSASPEGMFTLSTTQLTVPAGGTAGVDLTADTRVEAAELAAVRAASAQPLIAIDLALTHDFDPAVGALPGVELLTLESVRLAAPQEQAESLAQASGIVAGAASAFEQEREARSVDSAIVALRRHTMDVLDAEMERVRARHGCTAAAEEVEFALRRMVKQLLHVPTVRARELAANGQQEDYVAALEALYGITVEQPVAKAPDAACPVEHHDRPAPGSVRGIA